LPDQAAGALAGVAVQRITFSEVTRSAVAAALAAPRDVSQPLVDAYLARRGLDYLFGFTLSPLLWRKLPGARSAGARPGQLLCVLNVRALHACCPGCSMLP
jgi:DNA topoisomerase-1